MLYSMEQFFIHVMDVVTSTVAVVMELRRDSLYCGKEKLAAKLSGSSTVISTIICFHIICSDTQLGAMTTITSNILFTTSITASE
eukprot:scaffold103875_cov44-Attheya_sp.AAC.1